MRYFGNKYLEFLEDLRDLELEQTIELIKTEWQGKGSLLEIGAGTGWQSKKFSENGYSVEAIDLKHSEYIEHRVWKVLDYEGEHIPFPDAHFDIVFSSNVLEHIPHIIDFQKEILRVLKTDGIAVHLLPSGSWRFWTSLTHYPFWSGFVIKTIFSKIFRTDSNVSESPAETDLPQKTSIGLKNIFNGLIPKRHGEFGNALTEMYFFSKKRWVNLFQKTGWDIKKYSTNRLFYTGHLIFGSSLSLETRKGLSSILGSSCHVFLIKKK